MKLDEFLRLNAPEDLAALATAVAKSSVDVWGSVPFKAGLLKETNPSGETQKAIDVYSNDLFVEALAATGQAAEVASEEMEEPAESKGRISVAMDPLDGSSNVETNNPLGSIFGFYSHRLPASGRRLVGALYVTYGTMLTLTFSFGKGVHRFVALREGGGISFQLIGVGLKLPEKPEVYGFGGSRREWVPAVARFWDSLDDRGLRNRYCGTFVGDYNQVLARGGIFSYPALVKRPKGKLRVLYECAPMAYINEQAGGYASDGSGDVLDIEPGGLADASPLYIGNAALVHEIEERISPS
ncbi:MAG: fructose-1,6-bisphosphatase [Nitrososphaerota archaeon]|nr:fructose-1,6-bisphosphatase [Nitrososphaerota archaeon]